MKKKHNKFVKRPNNIPTTTKPRGVLKLLFNIDKKLVCL